MKREVVTNWKNESEQEDGKKIEGIKRGVLPYVITSLSPTFAIMNLQTMAGFPYFHFRINMLKWRSSIYGFKQKFPITFICDRTRGDRTNLSCNCAFCVNSRVTDQD
jgi:hypothetical protein